MCCVAGGAVKAYCATPILTSDVLTFYVCFQMSKKNFTDASSGAQSKKPVVVPSMS